MINVEEWQRHTLAESRVLPPQETNMMDIPPPSYSVVMLGPADNPGPPPSVLIERPAVLGREALQVTCSSCHKQVTLHTSTNGGCQYENIFSIILFTISYLIFHNNRLWRKWRVKSPQRAAALPSFAVFSGPVLAQDPVPAGIASSPIAVLPARPWLVRDK